MASPGHDRAAVIMADSGFVLSYRELHDRSVQLAGLFRSHGLAAGERVAILLENSPEWLIAAWGARRAGLQFVPINWHLKPSEIRHVIENSDTRGVISSRQLLPIATEATAGLDAIAIRLAVGGGDFEDFYAAIAPFSTVPPDVEPDGEAMTYSSGTTGKPKGILRPPSGAAFGMPNSLEVMLRDIYGLDRDTVYLSPAPLYHSAPVGWTGAVLAAGGCVVVLPSFDAEAALAAIQTYRVTHTQFVPTHLIRLLRLPDEVKNRYDLSSLRTVVHAAAPCPPKVKRAMIEWLGPIVHEYYGGSERCGFTAIDSAQWLAHPGSVGQSLTGAIHIRDVDTGRELPTGDIGGIYFEKPLAFLYHKDPVKTAGSFSPEGWATFGDLGHVDGEGYLYLADRRSDLIISGGVNIYPQEIEDALIGHPAVADVAVIGIPNEEFGQEVKAIIQLDRQMPRPDVAELVAYCRELLAGFKVPRTIDFSDALPRLPSGKLLRRELVEYYAARSPTRIE